MHFVVLFLLSSTLLYNFAQNTSQAAAVLARTDAHLFPKYTAEIMVIVIPDEKCDCLQLPALIAHQLRGLFHPHPRQEGDDRLSIFPAEDP